MDIIRIRLLGEFEISVNGKRVDDQILKSKKGCMLIQYLLLHNNEAVTYGDFNRVLWSGESSANPECALKTLVSRLRVQLSAISKDLAACIATVRGAYRWNNNIECEVDLFQFEQAYEQVTRLAPQELRDNIPLLKHALDFYHGDLLSASATEAWVTARSINLQNQYMELVDQYIELLQGAGDYGEIIRTCRRALEIKAFDERLHICLMDALARAKRNNEVLMQYKHASALYQRYLNREAPEGLQEFYKQIICEGKALDRDIGVIKKELCGDNEACGAFICDYAVFKEICNLQVRTHERGGPTIFLALVLVSDVDGQPLEPLKLDLVMQKLLGVLRAALRKGDTVARYTASQYALLLPLQKYDDGKIVLERIKDIFYQRHPDASIIISYRIDLIKEPLDPKLGVNRRLEALDKQSGL